MATASYTKFLPYGKQYHIFFFHAYHASKDREWTTDTIKELERYGYIGGCNSFHFDSSVSVVENVLRVLDKSIALAFVLSQISTNCKSFVSNMERTVTYMMEHEMEKSIVPVLIEVCKVPMCLAHYQALVAYDERNHWWPKLIRVLSVENQSSSSGESDEDMKEMCDEFMQRLSKMNIRKQKRFRKKCQESGLSTYIGQIGESETCRVLTRACGIEISSQCLVLELDRFVDIMEKSEDAMVEIGRLNKEVKITEIKLHLTKESEHKLFQFCKRNREKLINFIEQSLNFNCYGKTYDRMTYNVKFCGLVNYKLLHLMNNLARNLYLDKFQKRSGEFESYENRVRTFDTHPQKGAFVNYNEIAKAGFIFCGGTQTTYTCYQCNQSMYIYGSLHLTQPSEAQIIKNHIRWNTDCKHLTKYYKTDDIGPGLFYDEIADPCQTTERRIERNLKQTANTELAEELAKIGFIILTGHETEMLITCFKCHYYQYIIPDTDYIKQLERDHLLCSGEDCPFLVKEKGTSVILKFHKEFGKETHYKSSIIMKLIMMSK